MVDQLILVEANNIIINLLQAIDVITYQDDDGKRTGVFQSDVDLNEYIGEEIKDANKFLGK